MNEARFDPPYTVRRLKDIEGDERLEWKVFDPDEFSKEWGTPRPAAAVLLVKFDRMVRGAWLTQEAVGAHAVFHMGILSDDAEMIHVTLPFCMRNEKHRRWADAMLDGAVDGVGRINTGVQTGAQLRTAMEPMPIRILGFNEARRAAEMSRSPERCRNCP